MVTTRAAVIHKKNVHIGGGNATVTMKPDSLKTAKIAGKKRKALEDLRCTYLPVVGASKDDNLKKKSTRKGNEVKKNQMTQGKQSKSDLQGFGKGNKPFDIVEEIKQCPLWAPFLNIFIVTDEEIKQCYERAQDTLGGRGHIEETANIFKYSNRGRSSEYATDLFTAQIPGSEFEDFFKRSGCGRSKEYATDSVIKKIPGSEFEEPFTSEEKGYERDESESKTSVPGFLPSGFTPCIASLWLEDPISFPELKLKDGY